MKLKPNDAVDIKTLAGHHWNVDKTKPKLVSYVVG